MKKITILFALVNVIAAGASAQLTGPLNITGAQSNFAQYLSKSAIKNTENTNDKDAPVEVFNSMENTKGKRFLFDTWATGSQVTDAQGQPVNADSLLFNFDKLTGGLLVTQNKIDVMSVASAGIRSFSLQYKRKDYPFQHVSAIDSTKIFLKLAGVDSLYSLYKECKAKFVKSNYRDDGLIQTGNPYDEYIDESEYNITKPNSSTSRIITLKPKDIKNVLVSQKEKVNAYFKEHRNDAIDENFLVNLINYINK